MSLHDDVVDVQLSAITKDVMASRADPDTLIAAAELGDFVLTQLIIDGGVEVKSSRRRRRGIVEICLSQIQVHPSQYIYMTTFVHLHVHVVASLQYAAVHMACDFALQSLS